MSAALALDRPVYAAPMVAWRGETAEEEGAVLYAILVGFSIAAVSSLAAYCMAVGGSPHVSWTWRGFIVTCHR